MAGRLMCGVILAALGVLAAGGGHAAPDRDADCAYAPRGGGEMTTFNHCAWSDHAGRLRLGAKHRRALSFDAHGLSSVWVRGGWWYVDRGGRLAPAVTMDNGPDPFTNGLARSPAGKKVGFIDRRLRLVIAARYDGAHGFKNGRAVVCEGCELHHDPDNEHSWYQGGRWGCIDRHGRELYPWAETAGVGDMLDRCQ